MEMKKIKIFYIIAIVVLIVTLMGATYAYFRVQGDDYASNETRVYTHSTDLLTFSIDREIRIDADQYNFGRDANSLIGETTATATLRANNSTKEANEKYNLFINIETNPIVYSEANTTYKPELILQVIPPQGITINNMPGLEYTTVTDGQGTEISGYDITTKEGIINLANKLPIEVTRGNISGITEHEWTIRIVFVNLDFDQSINTDKELLARILMTKEEHHTVIFDSNGGETSVESKSIINGDSIGKLPEATKDDLIFIGWYTSQDEGTKINESTIINDNAIYYAHYGTLVCKRASSLHEYNSTTYGNIPVGYELRPGDAFDCDVDGVNGYDSEHERFYYLTTIADDYAVLIYYNNTSGGSDICGADGVNYGSNYLNGPTTAISELPSKTQWSNVHLYNIPRQIINENGTYSVGGDTASTFDYSGKAARFATIQEINAVTTSELDGTNNELNMSQYSFLLENIEKAGCRSNYWLENPLAVGGKAYQVDALNKRIGNSSGTSAVRPVIEVPIELMELDEKPVEFDTIPTAMRTYFNNVSIWNENQSDSNHSSYETAIRNNLTNNNCKYYMNDNVNTEYGDIYCDQPNKYDTGVNGDILVYEYNETTRAKTFVNYVSSENGKLYNMVPDKIYYWESLDDSTIHGYIKPTGERRLISISGTNRMTRNVRDLGGLPVDTDGDGVIDGKIKYQKIYRGEKIWGGDNETKSLFEKLGIYNEFDLRTLGTSEIVPEVEDQLQNYTSYEIVHYKVDFTEFGPNNETARINGKSYYELARDAAINVMQKIVNGDDNYAIYFHCRIGADRTGTLAYILEGLLGVPTEYRYQDYELTIFFGLRERTRYYYNKGNNTYKFIYFKNAIRNALENNINGIEDVKAWFLLGGNSTSTCNDIESLIENFQEKMIDYN